MRVLIQRVTEANVIVENSCVGAIKTGLLVFVGIEDLDNDEDIDWLARKIINMRIFGNEEKAMNKSLLEVGGELLVVSQFTLHASTKKGNRPSFIKAAKPDFARALYQKFVQKIKELAQCNVQTGIFGADMNVNLTNSGPVTLFIDSKDKK